MSRPVTPAPVLRLCSCLTSKRELLPRLESELIHRFGPLAMKSPVFSFEISNYYEREMGGELERHWYVFEHLFGAEGLADYRLATASIEEALSLDGKRGVNLDPGYLDLGKLVLASRKEAPDKIYLGRGVWAHTCLRYRDGGFTAPDHSFPDFRDGRFDRFMQEARRLYRSLLQSVDP
jgi:hypothetical protein